MNSLILNNEKTKTNFTFNRLFSKCFWLVNVPVDWISQNELFLSTDCFLGQVQFVAIAADVAECAPSSVNLCVKRDTIFDLPQEISTFMKSAEFGSSGGGDVFAVDCFVKSINLPPLNRCSAKSIDSNRNPIDFRNNVNSMASIVKSYSMRLQERWWWRQRRWYDKNKSKTAKGTHLGGIFSRMNFIRRHFYYYDFYWIDLIF